MRGFVTHNFEYPLTLWELMSVPLFIVRHREHNFIIIAVILQLSFLRRRRNYYLRRCRGVWTPQADNDVRGECSWHVARSSTRRECIIVLLSRLVFDITRYCYRRTVIGLWSRSKADWRVRFQVLCYASNARLPKLQSGVLLYYDVFNVFYWITFFVSLTP